MNKNIDQITKEAKARDKEFCDCLASGIMTEKEFASLRDRNCHDFHKSLIESLNLSKYPHADVVIYVASGQAGLEFDETTAIAQSFAELMEALAEADSKE